jgi:hypothetical protein
MKGRIARTITVAVTGGVLVAASGGIASASPATAVASVRAVRHTPVCPPQPGPIGAVNDLLCSLLGAVTGLVDGVLDPPVHLH